ncbi:DUF397 domain-containing protein [Micromonospora polyrhachis]|uniref:DUF397 domain-containing protein n=1 Tax=Micromonospora polyrhachis TaxID=1282883 RepID=A0A7W7WMW4_9ACTN|nr:DUF397 domain-containing protein [Micromonospora polyrhachis]MBB4957556.1 hypothetical protein [Micromonospora polyrhachis]
MTPSNTLRDANWRKSTYSGDQGACVEVAAVADTIAVRDSKDPAGPTLSFSPTAWAAFAKATPIADAA